MGVALVSKMVPFDNLNVEVSAWRYTCDLCGRVKSYHNVPVPYPEPEGDLVAQREGWRITYGPEDDERCFCPMCLSLSSPLLLGSSP
jgi:hypothetical protein